MILNTSKTVILKIHLTNNPEVNKEICSQRVTISPLSETKFLGVIIDSKQTFSGHIDFTVSKCNSRQFFNETVKKHGNESNRS